MIAACTALLQFSWYSTVEYTAVLASNNALTFMPISCIILAAMPLAEFVHAPIYVSTFRMRWSGSSSYWNYIFSSSQYDIMSQHVISCTFFAPSLLSRKILFMSNFLCIFWINEMISRAVWKYELLSFRIALVRITSLYTRRFSNCFRIFELLSGE